jgi:hypothetical protein
VNGAKWLSAFISVHPWFHAAKSNIKDQEAKPQSKEQKESADEHGYALMKGSIRNTKYPIPNSKAAGWRGGNRNAKWEIAVAKLQGDTAP